ncbi:helix-turn-helix transcriptional regulator [uncultured Methylobacterium sp.]|jgi:transcriptional regulator with XRE-family HTH domain|uniref:helix-turn-helix domain-containing protein n=1 Tax=uncultured Methylobacterium sp. TaxID=157278 RepID=UPI00261FD193|nr:helix-turn-helix transcriptional regulator [uncultured Methylobacterium sp.]
MDGRARIAWNLRRLRGARGLAQEALAVDAGVAAPYLSSIERGLANPTIDVLDRLAVVLRVDVAEFLVVPDLSLGPPPPLRAGRKPKQ